MVGDLIPKDNEVWMFYLKLRQIIDIITAPKLLRSHSILLDELVKDYDTLYWDFGWFVFVQFQSKIQK
ncbi:Protein of unknown function [Cotesia congregata]|uniref:Uncharacterized protein n=1 Tax=Cotesia congregata TaxID=51543 RepID=A0A8J2EN81_COTCN|nr:Protein of unknown function [Cotesia congregata]